MCVCLCVCFADVQALIQQSLSAVSDRGIVLSLVNLVLQSRVCAHLPHSSAEKVSFLSFHPFCPWWKLARALHKSQTTSGKEAAVSLAVLTCREGWLVSAAASAALTRDGWSRQGGHLPVRGCTGAWLSPPGPRERNCQWPSSPGLALQGPRLALLGG